MNGTFLQVSDIADTRVNLCVSFGSIANTDGAVVLAHHRDDPKKLLAYTLDATTNCTNVTAPPAGEYIVGVFTQSDGSALREPATTFTVSVVPIREYYVHVKYTCT